MPYRLHIPGEPSRALRWTTDHALSRYGYGVLLLKRSSEILDGATFRVLRDTQDAWIETDRPDRVTDALGMPRGESLGEP